VVWRPIPLSTIKADPLAQPKIHSSAVAQADQTGNPATPSKPAGAYRPPHARGTATPAAFKREDEGGVSYAGANYTNGFSNGIPTRERVVPGMAPKEPIDEKKTRSRRKKEKAEKAASADQVDGTPPDLSSTAAPAPAPAAPEPTGVSPEDLKKQRALLKKLRAIEELKLRQAGGEKLEKTQEQKIEKEDEIVQELKNLGYTD
jgi:translation initiation factor 2A